MLVCVHQTPCVTADETEKAGLIYQFFAYPSFAHQFGQWDSATQTYQVSGPWQAGLSNGANCGIVIGGNSAVPA